jgi:hypothetical protein
MEGVIPANHIDQFRQEIEEGLVYIIEGFIVADALKKYCRCTHGIHDSRSAMQNKNYSA